MRSIPGPWFVRVAVSITGASSFEVKIRLVGETLAVDGPGGPPLKPMFDGLMLTTVT